MMGIKRITQSKRTSIRVGSFIACIAILSLLPTAVAHAQLAAAASAINSAIYNMLIGIGSIFTLLGGLLLDYSVGMLVVGMGELMTGNIGFAVDQLWTIVRDIFNIVFIFSLIALGIQTILKSDDASTQRAIGYLIIAALLINFSLFITKTIVDFANITAYQIVEAMPDGGTAYTSVPLSTGETFGDTLIRGLTIEGGITGPFMDRMRLSSYAENGQFEILTGRDDGGAGFRTVMFGFLMMLLMIVAGFVFAAGAFLLIARFVTLIFLMIFSPILFLGWIYPSFSKYSKQYWDTFLRNAFVAPAYMFMIYLSMRVFSALGYGGQTGAGSFATVMDQSQWGTGIFMMIMYFVIIAGFLIGSVIVAQKIGAAGASTAINITNRGTRMAGAFSAGLGGRVGRGTAGYIGTKISDSESLRERASQRGIMGTLARGTLKSSRVVADSSFDARKITGQNIKVGGVTVDAGEAVKGGYKTQRDNIEKKEKEFAKSLGEVEDTDPEVQKIDTELKAAELKLKRVKITGTKAEIAAAQDVVNNLNERKQREKLRRQIGSTSTDEGAAAIQRQIEQNNIILNTLQESLARASETEAVAIRQEIADAQQVAKDLQASQRKILNKKGGYAGVLQQRGVLGSGFYLRYNNQDTSAGAAIRKQYEKQVKQSKEDKNNASLIEAVKSSVKKDA